MSLYGRAVLAVVLAGGEGKRLIPLTRDRAKPAIPIGGQYRLIDFVLSNLVHSNLLRIQVLTQYQSSSLIRHLSQGWNFSAHLGQYCEVIPAASGEGRGWYLGSADAVYQNMDNMLRDRPRLVAVFGADHMYRMDIRQMVQEHLDSGAKISVAVVPQPKEEAYRFGCVQVDDTMRVTNFLEKPSDPPLFPENPSQCLASMGNYIFDADLLPEIFSEDHGDTESRHDIGGNILPRWFDRLPVHAYNFLNNDVPNVEETERGYWRDVGTIDSFWSASMDLVSVSPMFSLYNERWPILTARSDDPPAKFVFADRESRRLGMATDSLVSRGCIISGGQIDRSVLSPNVRINSYANVEESIFNSVDIGRRCQIRKCIVDKGTHIPADTKIGFDEEEDRAHGIMISENGIRVIPREFRF